MGQFIDLIKNQSLDKLKVDAYHLETNNPEFASEAYEVIAWRCENTQQRETYLSLARHFYAQANNKQLQAAHH